jgi:Fe-S-cluster containining protein
LANLSKVKVFLKELDKGSWGYDVQILETDATVKDYLDSLNQFQEDKVAPCLGCSGCCWERAPLTAPDIFQFGNHLFAGRSTDQPIRRFLEAYGLVYAEEGVVDIIIRRDSDNACIFLDKVQQCCKQHSIRSFVCQSYICLPTSQRAAALREQIVNAGENELIRLYSLEFSGETPHIDEGKGAVEWSAYIGKGFTNKTAFDQVLIREVVDEALFQRLLI